MLDAVRNSPERVQPPLQRRSVPVLGITWENEMANSLAQAAYRDTYLPSEQSRWAMGKFRYDLVASYELDSHIPVLYPPLATFVRTFVPQTITELQDAAITREASAFMSISNCKAWIVPNRLALAKEISSAGFPIRSVGGCGA